MASISIRRREAKSGPRYVVRYRLGGRAYPLVHGGSFRTMKEARLRRDLVAGELAAGRNPADTLRVLTETPVRRTLRQWAEAYKASRVDAAPETIRAIGSQTNVILSTFGDRDPHTIASTDVQDWIAGLQLKPVSIRQYLSTLRAMLDYAGCDPNPARDPRIRLPRQEQATVEPPSGEQVEAIIASMPLRWRLPLRVLEQSGMRVGEAHELEWQDVDLAGSRFRIRHGKTASARRFVSVPPWLMVEIQETTPPDDRTAERRVFPDFTPAAARSAMRKACKSAGVPHFHPHDLRHRYASVKLREGVPLTDLAAQLGHARKSLTLDTYSHVLIDEQSA
jgi:integrase